MEYHIIISYIFFSFICYMHTTLYHITLFFYSSIFHSLHYSACHQNVKEEKCRYFKILQKHFRLRNIHLPQAYPSSSSCLPPPPPLPAPPPASPNDSANLARTKRWAVTQHFPRHTFSQLNSPSTHVPARLCLALNISWRGADPVFISEGR